MSAVPLSALEQHFVRAQHHGENATVLGHIRIRTGRTVTEARRSLDDYLCTVPQLNRVLDGHDWVRRDAPLRTTEVPSAVTAPVLDPAVETARVSLRPTDDGVELEVVGHHAALDGIAMVNLAARCAHAATGTAGHARTAPGTADPSSRVSTTKVAAYYNNACAGTAASVAGIDGPPPSDAWSVVDELRARNGSAAVRPIGVAAATALLREAILEFNCSLTGEAETRPVVIVVPVNLGDVARISGNDVFVWPIRFEPDMDPGRAHARAAESLRQLKQWRADGLINAFAGAVLHGKASPVALLRTVRATMFFSDIGTLAPLYPAATQAITASTCAFAPQSVSMLSWRSPTGPQVSFRYPPSAAVAVEALSSRVVDLRARYEEQP